MGLSCILGWGIGIILATVVFGGLFWKFYFLRLPWRDIPWKGVVSPADGKVVRIIKYGGNKTDVKKGILGKVKVFTKDVAKEGYLVVIMLTPFNVHYQRAPTDGKILSVKYSKGKFLNAVKGASGMKASFENEKNEILISNGKKKYKVIQVAGFLARRIEWYVKKNEKIHKGQLLGRINLGSQVILVLPRGKMAIKTGERVVDGETIIMKS